jgi:hypothetical protein
MIEKELIMNIDNCNLKLVSNSDIYNIWNSHVVIDNNLDNLIYISNEKTFNKAKKLIKINYTFKQVEEYFNNNYK